MTESLVFVFVDGLGLGVDDPDVNPLATDRYPHLAEFAGGRLTRAGIAGSTARHPELGSGSRRRNPSLHRHWLAKPIDANLGLDGLPQSGTGQATLFTGVNCVELAGRHYGPFPHSTSRTVIAQQNMFKRLVESGKKAEFANPYPRRFFTYVERTDRWTVTTLCCLHAGIRLKTGEDLAAGEAVAADITGAGWPEPSDAIEPVTPEEAGQRLARMADRSHFVLFEYFATDKAGHGRNFNRAHDTLSRLDAFIGGIVGRLDLSRQSLLLTSDHGNLEDLSTRGHTRNPVPLIVWGPAAAAFTESEDLVGITPAILIALGIEG